MASDDAERPGEELLAVYYNVFGPQPPTSDRWIKGNPETKGIQVVFRELLYDDWVEVSRVVSRESSVEMQDVVRVEQILARSIESTDGKEWPESLEDRLAIVKHWRASVVVVFSRHWVEFWEELQGQVQVLRQDPNSSGGTAGRSSRRKAAGGTAE